MRLTVIGKSPAWQDAGGACSSYMVEHDGTALLVDCGNGAFGRLRAHADHRSIDAVAITHIHADHVLDLYPFAYAIKLSPSPPARAPELWLPPGGAAQLDRISAGWGSPSLVADAFAVNEYASDSELEAGSFRLRFRPVPHYVPAWAIEVSPAGEQAGPRIVFGADCGPSDELARFAAGADLVVLEATLAAADPADPAPGHMSALQAGELAAAAAAARLLLTHFSDELDRDEVLRSGAHGYGSDPVLASEGLVVEL